MPINSVSVELRQHWRPQTRFSQLFSWSLIRTCISLLAMDP